MRFDGFFREEGIFGDRWVAAQVKANHKLQWPLKAANRARPVPLLLTSVRLPVFFGLEWLFCVAPN